MIRLEETTKVNLPIEDVFKYTSDFANIEQWDPGLRIQRKYPMARWELGLNSRWF